MSGRMDIDHGVLTSIAGTLHDASSDLDAIAGSAPGAPDAGDGAAAIAGILAKLIDAAGQIVVGASAAGDEVANNNASYRETDQKNADNLKKQGH